MRKISEQKQFREFSKSLQLRFFSTYFSFSFWSCINFVRDLLWFIKLPCPHDQRKHKCCCYQIVALNQETNQTETPSFWTKHNETDYIVDEFWYIYKASNIIWQSDFILYHFQSFQGLWLFHRHKGHLKVNESPTQIN